MLMLLLVDEINVVSVAVVVSVAAARLNNFLSNKSHPAKSL